MRRIVCIIISILLLAGLMLGGCDSKSNISNIAFNESNITLDSNVTPTPSPTPKSPPLILEIDSIRTKNDYTYCYGVVRNVGLVPYKYIKVKIAYYDSNEESLTSDWTYVVGSEGLPSGENQQFEIMTKVRGIPSKYGATIIDCDPLTDFLPIKNSANNQPSATPKNQQKSTPTPKPHDADYDAVTFDKENTAGVISCGTTEEYLEKYLSYFETRASLDQKSSEAKDLVEKAMELLLEEKVFTVNAFIMCDIVSETDVMYRIKLLEGDHKDKKCWILRENVQLK